MLHRLSSGGYITGVRETGSSSLNQQAFCALTSAPGARAYYNRHRASGATHQQALRALASRLVGSLHGCLHRKITNNEQTAWGHRTHTDLAAAA